MNRSRLLVLCFSCAVVSLQASLYPDLSEFKRGFKINAERCAKTHHVQYMQVLAVMEAPQRTSYDRNSKCFLCCMMEKYQMLTPDGEFLDGNMKKISAELPPSEMKNVVEKFLDTCLHEDNEDTCEKCYQFAKCYYDHSKTSNYQVGGYNPSAFNKYVNYDRNQPFQEKIN